MVTTHSVDRILPESTRQDPNVVPMLSIIYDTGLALTRHCSTSCSNIVSMLVHCLRRWPNIETTLGDYLVVTVIHVDTECAAGCEQIMHAQDAWQSASIPWPLGYLYPQALRLLSMIIMNMQLSSGSSGLLTIITNIGASIIFTIANRGASTSSILVNSGASIISIITNSVSSIYSIIANSGASIIAIIPKSGASIILWNSIALTSNIFTELANIMLYKCFHRVPIQNSIRWRHCVSQNFHHCKQWCLH